MSRPAVRVFPDAEAMSRAAAEFLLETAQRAITSQGRFALALSGGSTPRRLYALLAASPYRDGLDWGRVHLFWVDERCVPAHHEESNYKLAADAFLSRVSVPRAQVHRIRGDVAPDQAARAYEDELRAFFGSDAVPAFDLIILGAGEDGHTASLFPRSAALKERNRLVVPVALDAPKLDRVTLTLPVLNHAAGVLFLATGSSKATVVHEILEDKNPKQYPAGLVRPAHGTVTWMADRAAASLLTRQVLPRTG